jgi:hypothetical protein
MVFNATFNNIHLCRGGQFYWWMKLEYPEKTTELPHSQKGFFLNKGNNKISELRTIFQRESQNS